MNRKPKQNKKNLYTAENTLETKGIALIFLQIIVIIKYKNPLKKIISLTELPWSEELLINNVPG